MLLVIAAFTAYMYLYLETILESCSLAQSGGPGRIHCSAFCSVSPLNVWRPLTFVGCPLSSTGQTGFRACGRREVPLRAARLQCVFLDMPSSASSSEVPRLTHRYLVYLHSTTSSMTPSHVGMERPHPLPVTSLSQKLFPRFTCSEASELSIAHAQFSAIRSAKNLPPAQKNCPPIFAPRRLTAPRASNPVPLVSILPR